YDPDHAEARRELAELRRKVEGLPLRLTVDSANVALAIDLSDYPLPRFRKPSASPTPAASQTATSMSFRDEASSAGLRFRYFNGVDTPPSQRMFEFTGGGIGVLDFDLDGYADVCFTQGRPWPAGAPAPVGGGDATGGDRLFQNRGGVRFEDVTASAGIREEGFGQGVTVGDFNSDGFPDLYVANIGANCLWRNNGDGTFTDATDDAGLTGDEWTTSCVMADLNGDALPDIYDVNYVMGDDVYERVCRAEDGSPALCMPFHFDSQPDRLWLNDGHGRFTDATADVLSVVPSGKGLGVAVWDAHGTGRLSLLVANDTTPCFFFTDESAADGRFRLEERGIASGLALNGEGKATGCMGIALGDVGEDGRLDVLITNFHAEPNTLFMNLSEGVYADRTRALGLNAPSLNVLGFGTQFLDVDLDGRLELFVSNGHVDDLRESGRPYRMPPQLFRWNGRRFLELDAAELGPYFEA
ncbi:MAG: FG-GAP repeat domain-containing protein, partial [Planctomycetaceae bacterium]